MRRTAALLLVLALSSPQITAAEPVDFNRDVRPILSEHCFACHGPDAARREADLRLDTRDGLFDDRGGYAAVVPKQPGESELIARITSNDDFMRMPPADGGKPLSPQQIATLRRWVEQGARWQGHWAYIKPERPDVPEVEDSPLVSNEIDRFVLAQLRQRGLAPSPEADRVTLIRRLSFDLTGLPPTPEEVDEFVNDQSPRAWEDLVDRLLASPHYGERMAQYWLDVARFADTNGIHGDNHRDIWLYRDYVIQAFNRNKPFDEFTIEQIAGDLIDEPTRESRIASGYNRVLMTTREGGAQPKEYMAKYSADRVRNTATAWLGSTLGCAECHDHKYDPFLTKDFYSFAAFFADLQETAVGVQPPTKMPTPDQDAQLARLDAELAELTKTLQTPTFELTAAQQEWEQQARAELASQPPVWTAVRPKRVTSSGGATLEVQDDLSVLAGGKNPKKDTYTIVLPTELSGITGVRLEALTHPSLANKSLSRANGNFVLTEFDVRIARSGDEKPEPVKLKQAVADYSQNGHPIANAIDGKSETGWAVDGHTKAEDRTAVFVFAEPLPGGPGTKLTVRLRHQSPFAQHNIGRFRLALTTVEEPSLDGPAGLPPETIAALHVEPAERTPEQAEVLAKHYRGIAPELEPVRRRIAELEKERDQLDSLIPTTLISISGEPRPIRILPRGNWLDDSGPLVAPAVPEFLGDLGAAERASRLDLARWLVARDNPLVARVFVNRLWMLLFGRGIVSTPDDFGAQGAWPTHPRLLDWLAVEFIESGWDVKHMVKLIALSGTYRQSSDVTPDARQADPYNQWLARQGRFRLDAEMIRDNALSVSGLLVREMGGPSAKPYQPAGYWSHLNFPKREYEADTGPDQYRRGVYSYWCRTFLHPSLKAFDAPTREECTAERPRSNTPLQALVLLNDPSYVEAARALAERVLREGGQTSESRLEFLCRAVLSRKPRDDEARVLTEVYKKHLRRYSREREDAAALLSIGQRPTPPGVDAGELAAWTSVARIILNLHETITRF